MAELTPDATKAINMRANGERPWSFHDSFDVCRNDRLLLLQHSDALSARLAEAEALLREWVACATNIGSGEAVAKVEQAFIAQCRTFLAADQPSAARKTVWKPYDVFGVTGRLVYEDTGEDVPDQPEAAVK